MRMEIAIIDSTGRNIGTVKGCTVFNMKGKKVCKVKPKTKILQIVRILLSSRQGDPVR